MADIPLPRYGPGNLNISTNINHPTLRKHDAESIRIFLRKYDQYVTEIVERSAQYGDVDAAGTARPVQLKFCVDSEYLASAIDLGFVDGVDTIEELTDPLLRAYLEKKAETSKETVTLSALDKMVEKHLSMNMSDPSATSRMQGLFISYTTLLRKSGLSWVLKENQKVAVQHVLSAINPTTLRTRLSEDLEFSQYNLRKDFRGFMNHAIKLAEAFQLLDSGRNRNPVRERNPSTTTTNTPTRQRNESKREPAK